MTDRELAQQAWREFQMADRPWSQVANYPPARLARTRWGKGKKLLDMVGSVPSPTASFGSRPQVAAFRSYYAGDFSIDNKTIVGSNSEWNGAESGRGLEISGSSRTVISNCDFVGVPGSIGTGIYMDDCSGTLLIQNCRFFNVGWNALQINHSTFTGGRIQNIKVKGGRNEDIINLFGGSGGVSAADPLIIEDFFLEGDPAKCRISGSGLMFEAAQHVIARNFTMLNPGQVGFGVHPGTNIRVMDGTIYSQAYKLAAAGDTGADLGDPAITAGSLTEVARVKSKWFAINGSENPVWVAGNANNITGWDTNNWSASIDPAALAVVL